MKVVKVKRGLDIPISGKPTQVIGETKKSNTVAILGNDYVDEKARVR